jgi:hypothetical protein
MQWTIFLEWLRGEAATVGHLAMSIFRQPVLVIHIFAIVDSAWSRK